MPSGKMILRTVAELQEPVKQGAMSCFGGP